MRRQISTFLCTWIFVNPCSAASLQKPLAIVPPKSQPSSTPESPAFLPLVVWHGLGDSYNAEGLQSIGTLVNETNPGTFTYFIRLDEDGSADSRASFLGNLTQEVEKVCADLEAHPILSTAPAINALGFSQGGLFLRAYVERCNRPPVANLVTFGSPHNGLIEFKRCDATDWLCHAWWGLLKGQTWTSFVQSNLVPAQYFRDPADLENYLEHSNFLADINNERALKNVTYKQNLQRLDKFAMYLFADDEMILPKESAWFCDKNMTTGEVTKLQDRQLFKKDWIGLRALDEQKRLDFRIADGGHMHLTDELLVDAFKTYFRHGPDRDAKLEF